MERKGTNVWFGHRQTSDGTNAILQYHRFRIYCRLERYITPKKYRRYTAPPPFSPTPYYKNRRFVRTNEGEMTRIFIKSIHCVFRDGRTLSIL